MNENKSLNEQQEQVLIYPNPRRIKINCAHANRAYGLFDSETGTQVSDFKKGTTGQVEFDKLDPGKHYDVGTIEAMGDEKPEFAIMWTHEMKDNTDEILKKSGNNSDNIFDIIDDKGETVGQVAKLSPTGDKPEFHCIHSLKIKDDTQK